MKITVLYHVMRLVEKRFEIQFLNVSSVDKNKKVTIQTNSEFLIKELRETQEDHEFLTGASK